MRKSFGDVVSEAWGVPKECVMNIAKITLAGNREIYIENHKGIVRYTTECICVSTPTGILEITGKNLKIDRIRAEDMLISGFFEKMCYKI